jgi:ubiquinone/menaquinone biosynthesis C-methylase UbiE
MSSAEGAQTFFRVAGDAYDRFMGRYSRALAAPFVDAVGVTAGARVLDVGCGTGALTEELVGRLGADAVAAVDPSESFVEACRNRNPDADVRLGRAEELPFADDEFDAALAQLVLHFVTEPDAAAAEMRRVLRPAGKAAACVWDFAEGMPLLRSFWDSARAVEAIAPGEGSTTRFGKDGEIAELFVAAGFHDVTGGALEVEAAYDNFDDLWAGFLAGSSPAGSFCTSLAPEPREQIRRDLQTRLGNPDGPFSLGARAWYAVGLA